MKSRKSPLRRNRPVGSFFPQSGATTAAFDAAARKRETNRQNASKSTGPRTEAGKAASSKNRLAHGLCSESLLVRGETQEEFDELSRQTHFTFEPATPEEIFLTDQLTESLWRLNRARRVEAKAFDRMMDLSDQFLSRGGAIETDQDTGAQLGTALFDPNHQKTMATLPRYVTAAERTYRQTLKAVQEASNRRPALVEESAVAQKPKAMAAGQSFPFETGFEPQFPANPSVSTSICQLSPRYEERPKYYRYRGRYCEDSRESC